MDLIESIKSLTPVSAWETVANPTGQVAGAIGDNEYEGKTEIGYHKNHIYQILHYANGEAMLVVDLVDKDAVPAGVESFASGGEVDLQKMVDSVKGYIRTMTVYFQSNGEVKNGRMHS